MEVQKTGIEGLLVLKPRVFCDDRGYFFESFNAKTFEQLTRHTLSFVQDNESKSIRGVLRGLHYQLPPFAQSKLVRVVKGTVWDVAVDIRPASPTFGKWYGVELSEENKQQFFIPRGFAHGFVVLSPEAIFQYKVDNFYDKDSEGSIAFNDPTLAIDWKISPEEIILSQKDVVAPLLVNARKFE